MLRENRDMEEEEFHDVRRFMLTVTLGLQRQPPPTVHWVSGN